MLSAYRQRDAVCGRDDGKVVYTCCDVSVSYSLHFRSGHMRGIFLSISSYQPAPFLRFVFATAYGWSETKRGVTSVQCTNIKLFTNEELFLGVRTHTYVCVSGSVVM